MKTIANLLENFCVEQPTPSDKDDPASARDDELLDSFEQGYKAGWEDAIRAKAEEKAHVSAALAGNLQELTFTYHDAKTSVLADLGPVLNAVVRTLLPKVAYRSMGERLVEQLLLLAETNSTKDVRISVASTEVVAVSELLPENLAFPVLVTGDASLSPGQAHINFSGREQQIDLDELLAELEKSIEAFDVHTRHKTKKGSQ
ncbi:hypothetical protein [Shimia thalassica]|uniref:hypothetical protein n=1 Tax=Shimia thalassica TaxID=1715693 RepID=UPI0026E31527|nr:hypothetical protein [Shimia thalassica]MDO6799080.1 hypothetical protein [Shimia thalassica]